MSLTEAMDQYKRCLKQGQKDYRADVLRGRYPYPQVLDEILDESIPHQSDCRHQERRPQVGLCLQLYAAAAD